MNVDYYMGHSIHTARAMSFKLFYLFWHQSTIMTWLQLMLYTTGICKSPQSQVITFYLTQISRYNHDTHFIRDVGWSSLINSVFAQGSNVHTSDVLWVSCKIRTITAFVSSTAHAILHTIYIRETLSLLAQVKTVIISAQIARHATM